MRFLTLSAVIVGTAVCTVPFAGSVFGDTFTLLIYESKEQLALRTDKGPRGQDYWDGYARYGKALQDAGVIRGGGVFVTGDAVRSVTLKGDKAVDALGKSEDTRLGGTIIIEVADAKAAVEWASKLPAASAGRVVVHPQAPTPGTMPPK